MCECGAHHAHPHGPPSWFEHVTGLTESAWLRRDRSTLIESAPPIDGNARFGPHLLVKNTKGGPAWDAGAFATWNMHELEAEISKGAATAPVSPAGGGGAFCTPTSERVSPPPRFEVLVRRSKRGLQAVDVCYLQSIATSGSSLFQVASNFNCLENPSVLTPPDGGSFVTDLMVDRTQGPAASSGAGVASIARAHAAFFDDPARRKPEEWGQHFHVAVRDDGSMDITGRQVELLGADVLRPHFPVTNGKLYALTQDDKETDSAKTAAFWPPASADERERMMREVRVGLHAGVFAHFVRVSAHEPPPASSTAPLLAACKLVTPPPAIDQVFCAALNVHARGIAPPLTRDEVSDKMRFLLQAAYEGTYACAALRRSRVLVLTCVGGGVFGNPLDLIAEVAADAHARWAPRCPFLEKVVLPLFTEDADGGLFASAFEKRGCTATIVHVDADEGGGGAGPPPP